MVQQVWQSICVHATVMQKNARNCLKKQTKVTEYYASSQALTIPKKIKEKVKIACTEFTALDCRAFEVVSGEGFKKLTQSIFDAGRHTRNSSSFNITHLILSPTIISRNIDHLYEEKKVQLTSLCMKMSSYCIICDFWTERFTGNLPF
ncbi:unnamed protein product [Rotaria socialis]|uniref:Hermes trasposase DNA-binding domain-containing protein n=1 Tax=Rotaria socialis TaxID=392032 RepID=A0A821YNK1_9BILA|nr:unnamed protein product [Rotaria socialis]